LVFSYFVYFAIKSGQTKEINHKVNTVIESTDYWGDFSTVFNHNITEPLAILMLQIITIILVARLLGFLLNKIGQPTVIGEIVAGILLGPSFVGLYFPEYSSFLFPA